MLKAYPRHAGNRIGILRGTRLFFCKNTVAISKGGFVRHICGIKFGKVIVKFRPQKGECFVVLMKNRIYCGKRIVKPKNFALHGKAKFFLFAKNFCCKPKISGEKLFFRSLEHGEHMCYININGYGAAGGRSL